MGCNCGARRAELMAAIRRADAAGATKAAVRGLAEIARSLPKPSTARFSRVKKA